MSKKDPISLFHRAGHGRSSEDVALQIEAAILSGELSPGEGLPSERELQDIFGTSRGVVREALRALKEKGLLEIRKGAKGGAFVKQMEVARVSESLALFLKTNNFAPERLIEFRESMDRTVTVLAIARGSAEAKSALVDGAERLAGLAMAESPDMHALGELDRELNLQLVRLADNPIFEWVMGAVQSGFSSYDYALYEEPAYRAATVANWVETARSIAEGEPQKALSSIGHHYVLLRRCVRDLGPESLPANELLVEGDAGRYTTGPESQKAG
ncbi:FadR/GntR family transcriptional regulator [Desulfohalovibrio reitneri]|uniref:FadR/GntR family transcriptional regulator n=1 Tax=Desulfohalovibrio reitneri TaxID=1307759 RepID=UPI0009DFDB56|nr:GntR family transcriptional regulator [Desulfohalovibrio reitneri]